MTKTLTPLLVVLMVEREARVLVTSTIRPEMAKLQ
jgi:hypothetical protein